MNISTQDTPSLQNSAQECYSIKKSGPLALPKSRSRKPLQKPDQITNSDTQALSNMIDSIDCENPFKSYDRLNNLFTKLKHKSMLSSISLEILINFSNKMRKIITTQSAIEFSKTYLKEVKKVLKILEPSKAYLNLVGTPDIDQRLLLDEVLESILKLVKNCLEKLIIPLSFHPTKESQKILENKKLKICMASLCGVLEYLCCLISKKCFQEHWLIALSELLIKTLFSEGAELLHLACCSTLACIVNSYNKITLQVLNEIINNLLILTSDPNLAIGSKSKKIHCRDYAVAENIEIKFSSYMIVQVLQSYSSLGNGVKVDGETDKKMIETQLSETLGLAQHFINEVTDRCLKNKNDSQEYRTFMDTFIEDILKIMYRPEFPIAYQVLNFFVFKLLNGLKTSSAAIRHFIIDQLSNIANKLKSSIHEIKLTPIVPQHISKVPITAHPSENSMASICICKEGWTTEKCKMVQCEEC